MDIKEGKLSGTEATARNEESLSKTVITIKVRFLECYSKEPQSFHVAIKTKA